ncbi:hypothetical protein DPMN_138324 [Dreissena polymorpha]|uniref:Uncharacterized protein n=1 Tax=Dreissena polymorpha TaxID=45954 RepID=A0A9D4G9K0_DREPO|nr:hypothetical protein DPMN_138324 [Dreissena polymorpha]
MRRLIWVYAVYQCLFLDARHKWVNNKQLVISRFRTIKRDISLTRTNILANKSVSSEEESTNQNQFTNEHLERPQMATFPRAQSSMRRPTMVPVNQIMDVSAHNLSLAEHSHTIPRAHPGQISVYNKHGWHEGFADRSFYDNTTDIYPESSTTTRSTGPFITESAKSPSNGGVGVVSPFAINRNGPYIVDGRANEGYNGTMGRVHYANDPQQEWHQNECMSDNEPDLVLF